MYTPQYIQLEEDIYRSCVNTARSYYRCLQRRREIEDDIINSGRNPPDGMPRGGLVSDETADKTQQLIMRQETNDRKIKAVEDAWHAAAQDETEQELIRQNLFLGVWCRDINLPLSRRTMARIRKKFLVHLAINLCEI